MASSKKDNSEKRIPVLSAPFTSNILSAAETKRWLDEVDRLIDQRPPARGNLSRKRREYASMPDALPDVPVPILNGLLLKLQLNELHSWQNEATLKLHDLVAGRNALGPESMSFSIDVDSQRRKVLHRLISQLSKNALSISTLEAARGRWHVAAFAAQEAIRLRSEVAISATGHSLNPSSRAYMKLAYATFMLEGNSPHLRRLLRDGIEAVPGSKGLTRWLAHYEIMAGNLGLAYEAIQRVPKDAMLRDYEMLAAPGPEDPPWKAFPSNFYTYRHSWIDNETISQIQDELATIEGAIIDDSDPMLERLQVAKLALQCLKDWNHGNDAMNHAQYGSAAKYYQECRKEILRYFSLRHPDKCTYPSIRPNPCGEPEQSCVQAVQTELASLARNLIVYGTETQHIWHYFRRRYCKVTLKDLCNHDWVRPWVTPDEFPLYDSATALLLTLAELPEKIEEKIDAPLLALALVFLPLAIAESYRMRRNFDIALRECRYILRRHDESKILCQVIEVPFIRILIGQILLEKGNSEYQARTPSTSTGARKYQGLAASETYEKVLELFRPHPGEYVNRVADGTMLLKQQIDELSEWSIHPLLTMEASLGIFPPMLDDRGRTKLQLLGKEMPIETITSIQDVNPGFERTVGPHDYLIKYVPPAGHSIPEPQERNPLIYALIIEAKSRLLQLEAGLNFLGYRDDYVPPWRFQFLLDRARYYAEHAKNSQREYLNFLQNAEREEFQEMSVAQNVVLEKSNIRLETARVEQVRSEVEAVKKSKELAELSARNARIRYGAYADFDRQADRIADKIVAWSGVAAGFQTLQSGVSGSMTGLQAGGVAGAIVGAIVGTVVGAFTSGSHAHIQRLQLREANAQREFEKKSLRLAISESTKSAEVAEAQLNVASDGLVVAAMRRASALLRHEFAVQSLKYHRNRTLNAELWYRIAHLIRGISEIYLRYATELAFLAEQAYEFEADKRLNVIRFDYDLSEVGDMLAADFLLRDIDTLEQDQVVTRDTRRQHVQYVLSMARELPEALHDLRENGFTTFSLRLEQLERRYPGLFNMHIGDIEVLPVALMDPTRFSLALTHLGSGQVRLKLDPDLPLDQIDQSGTSPLNVDDLNSDDTWLAALSGRWPVKLRTTEPQTAIFSGLSREERSQVFPFETSSQRHLFEELAPAAAWHLDMSMQENQVVPDTLADILITFNLSGYYDSELHAAIDAIPRSLSVLTRWLSGKHTYADEFYDFIHTGRMVWSVQEDLLTLRSNIGSLRNLGIILAPRSNRPHFGRIMNSHVIEFSISMDGQLNIITEVPDVNFTLDHLILGVQVNVSDDTTATWDFGDDSGWQTGERIDHEYSSPGEYTVRLRIMKGSRLFELLASVVVSEEHLVTPPLAVLPTLTLDPGSSSGYFRLTAIAHIPDDESVSIAWTLMDEPTHTEATTQFELQPGNYRIVFSAIRDLNARFYCQQRYIPDREFIIEGLRMRSNRRFEESTHPLNELATHLFSEGAISPVDRWTLVLPTEDNPFLRSVTDMDTEKIKLSEIADALLAVEFESNET